MLIEHPGSRVAAGGLSDQSRHAPFRWAL